MNFEGLLCAGRLVLPELGVNTRIEMNTILPWGKFRVWGAGKGWKNKPVKLYKALWEQKDHSISLAWGPGKLCQLLSAK